MFISFWLQLLSLSSPIWWCRVGRDRDKPTMAASSVTAFLYVTIPLHSEILCNIFVLLSPVWIRFWINVSYCAVRPIVCCLLKVARLLDCPLMASPSVNGEFLHFRAKGLVYLTKRIHHWALCFIRINKENNFMKLNVSGTSINKFGITIFFFFNLGPAFVFTSGTI